MSTARLTQGTPLLLNGVTKRYGEKPFLTPWICISLPGNLWPWSVAAAAVRVRCCAC